jgi:hypothetical protein
MANLLANPITGSQDVRRVYAVLRGEGAAVGLNFATRDVLRSGTWHDGTLAVFPAPSDAALNANGVQVSGGFTAQIAFPIEGSSTAFYALPITARDQTFTLELFSILTNPDGTTLEISNIRKAVCKAASRRNFMVTLQFVSVDTSTLKQLYPPRRFDIATWPQLYADHVNRSVPVVVGTGIKVPLAWIRKPGGGPVNYGFAGPEQLNVGDGIAWLTAYRRGRIIGAAEYSANTYTSGYSVFNLDFAREQRDTSNGLYELTADVTGSLSRNVIDEIQRLLQYAGITIDAPSFATAQAYAAANAMLVDCCYSRPRTLMSILQQLLIVARAFLRETATGAWAIVQDVPKSSALTLDEKIDLIEISGEDFIEVPSAVSVEYRPKDDNENYSRKLTRAVGGTGEEVVYRNQYIRDNATADRFLCYMALRAARNRRATVRVHAANFENGEVVTISSRSAWLGSTQWMIEKVERPVDENILFMREYDAAVYTYTAGALPADYTNDYAPDYAQTPPLAPTGLAVFSQATAINTDGTVKAYALIRAVPPSVNWSKLFALATNVATKEIYLVELKLNLGNYEGTLTNMSPGQAHTLVAYANNGNLDGAVATLGGDFTSAENAAAPAAPASAVVAQITGAQVQVIWAAVTGANIRHYEIQRSTNAGAFQSYAPGRFIDGASMIDETTSYGSAYQYRLRAIDTSNNAGAWVNSNTLTPTVNINSSNIIPAGVLGSSISNGAINRVRTQTGTGSITSSSVAPGNRYDFVLPDYAYANSITTTALSSSMALTAALNSSKPGGTPATAAAFGFRNNDPTNPQAVTVDYRSVT